VQPPGAATACDGVDAPDGLAVAEWVSNTR
jgi:hypothetical protein